MIDDTNFCSTSLYPRLTAQFKHPIFRQMFERIIKLQLKILYCLHNLDVSKQNSTVNWSMSRHYAGLSCGFYST